MDMELTCPGRYCGRLNSSSQNISACGACPWGYTVQNYECQKCDNVDASLYDWLYLVFMALLIWIFNAVFVEYKRNRHTTRAYLLVQHVSALMECIISFCCSVLVLEPRGQFSLRTCGVNRIADWYPLFYNPVINYTTTVYCTQEVVYPLYSFPFIYYGFTLLFVALFRTASVYALRYVVKAGANAKQKRAEDAQAVYAILYFVPLLTLLHAVLAGVIYFAYPFLLVVGCLVSNAVYLAMYTPQTFVSMLKTTFTEPRHLVVILAHCSMYEFAIVAVSKMGYPTRDGPLFLLVFVPSIFYFVTVSVTNPAKLNAGYD